MDFIVWYEVSRIWAWIAFLAGLSAGLFFSIVFFSFLLDNRKKVAAGLYDEKPWERGIPIE